MINNRMKKTVDYGKQKKNALAGMIIGAVVLVLGLVFLVSGLFFYLDARNEAIKSQARETWFDPMEYSENKAQTSYKTLDAIGLSYDFAVDFKETYHYYFAFDVEGYPYIVKLKGDLTEEQLGLVDYLFGDESMEMPEPICFKGVAAPIEEDIREFAIDALNELYADNFIDDSNFEDYMGYSFLDTTQKPMGMADFSYGYTFMGLGAAFAILGVFNIVFQKKRRTEAILAEERDKVLLSRMSTYSSDAPSIEASEDLQTVMDRAPEQGNGDQLQDIVGQPEEEKEGNMLLGIIGAIGGSLLGVALWLVLGLVGFIAGIAGFVMLKFALLGYQKLSGKLDKKGAMICLFIAAFMVFGANVLDYGIAICKGYFQFEASLDTVRYVVLNFTSLMSEHEMWGGFAMNLVIGYVLSIWSSHSLIGAILRYKE